MIRLKDILFEQKYPGKIAYGSRGEDVEKIQQALVDLGYDLGSYGDLDDGVDGIFGPETKRAVLQYQKDSFKDAAERTGVVSPSTWSKLFNVKVDADAIEKFEKQISVDSDLSVDNIDASGLNLDKIQFAPIPGTTNYRSGQPTLEQLKYIIQEYNIKNIIRLNGDQGSDPTSRAGGTILSSQERELAESMGVTFYPKSGDHVSAHSGFKKGQGYTKSIKYVQTILDKGHTLIHCRNGADRTGYLVAKYLQDKQGQTDEQKLWNYTTQYNSWCGMQKFFGSGYDKYAHGFIKNLDTEKYRKLCSNRS